MFAKCWRGGLGFLNDLRVWRRDLGLTEIKTVFFKEEINYREQEALLLDSA
jgi:hypothetical protein